MEEAHRILADIPDSPYDVRPWIQKVKVWTDETKAVLETYSARAGSVFMLPVDSVSTDSLNALGKSFFTMPSAKSTHPEDPAIFLRESYQQLISRMENLRKIMESPETYL